MSYHKHDLPKYEDVVTRTSALQALLAINDRLVQFLPLSTVATLALVSRAMRCSILSITDPFVLLSQQKRS
jgi:hypothetical protein